MGHNALLTNWRLRNQKRKESKDILENKKAAAAQGKKGKYKPDRAAKKGDAIALYSGKSTKDVFYVAKVVDVLADGKLRVHWWSSKNVDGS